MSGTGTHRVAEVRTGAMLLVVSAGLITACDTGDGTTLRDPDPDAPPATDVPITPTTLDVIEASVEPAPTETATLPAPDTPTMELFAPWPDGGEIDLRYGCDGDNATPALSWTEIPDDTAELAITMVNESDVSRGDPFVHWVMWGLDPTRTGVAESEEPAEALLALNFFGNVAYDGPCPTPGTTDVYRFTVHALFQQLELADGTPAAEVIDTIELLSIAEARLLGSSTR